jgi:hypothetical protein
MSTNCSLYRSNRITPIYTLLNSSCLVLGDSFPALVDRFWNSREFRDGQYFTEVEKFAHFLKRLIAAGELDGSRLEEVLDFEVAANALLFSPRRQILAALEQHRLQSPEPPDPAMPWTLHPLVRVVRFHHEPGAVFQALGADEVPGPGLVEGSFFVALSLLSPALEVMLVAPSAGRALTCAAPGAPALLAPEVAPEMCQAGLLIPYRAAQLLPGSQEVAGAFRRP